MHFPSIFDILVAQSVFLTKSLTTGILFLTSLIFVLRTAAVTKPLTSGIFLSTSSIFSLQILFIFALLVYVN